MRSCLAEGTDFRMGFAGPLVPAFTHNDITPGNDTANPRVGMRRKTSAPGQLNGSGHQGSVPDRRHDEPFELSPPASTLATSAGSVPSDSRSISSLNSFTS